MQTTFLRIAASLAVILAVLSDAVIALPVTPRGVTVVPRGSDGVTRRMPLEVERGLMGVHPYSETKGEDEHGDDPILAQEHAFDDLASSLDGSPGVTVVPVERRLFDEVSNARSEGLYTGEPGQYTWRRLLPHVYSSKEDERRGVTEVPPGGQLSVL
ncbi:unnamed protein product [Peniophora sp. CBMAI 1063]|nr:unnamed protein product [Peniophora sp. CBMAI 1063]